MISANEQAGGTKLVNHSGNTTGSIKDSLDGIIFKNLLGTTSPGKLFKNVGTALVLGKDIKVVIHDDSLPERFMDVQGKGMIEDGKAGKKNNGAITGIHVKVKEHLEVIKDGIGDIVGLVNDEDGSNPLFESKTGYLGLDDLEIIGLSIGRDQTELVNERAIEFHDSQGRHSGITNLKERRIQRSGKMSDHGRFAEAGSAGQKAKAFSGSKIVKAKQSLLEFRGLNERIVARVFQERIELKTISDKGIGNQRESPPSERCSLLRLITAFSCLLRRRMGTRVPEGSMIKILDISEEYLRRTF